MIKMTDNQQENTYAFFCDICGLEIAKGTGEMMFKDTNKDEELSVIPHFVHYGKCSKSYEIHNGLTGNMPIAWFVNDLYETFGTKL